MSERPETGATANGLVAFVRRQAEEKAQSVLAEAHARATAIEREAFAEARRRLDRVKRQERARAQDLCRAAEARMHSRIARRRREIDARRLRQMRQQFSSVLEEFWRTPSLREAWIRAAVARATAVLDFDHWTLELSDVEETGLPDGVRTLLPKNAKIVFAGRENPGLRIRREDATLDATAAGFLAQGARLDAQLLASLSDHVAGEAE